MDFEAQPTRLSLARGKPTMHREQARMLRSATNNADTAQGDAGAFFTLLYS
jgi:hypothetical protein